MSKKTIRDIDLTNRRVLMRVDFNVPLESALVTDDTRIRAALPSIQYVLEQEGSSLVLMSHCGRPKGSVKPEFSLKPAADRLSELLGRPVALAPDCIGPEVTAMVQSLQPGGVLLLENLRFHPEEEGKVKPAEGVDEGEARAAMKEQQREFARQLAQCGDVYVSDAFGTAHRAHASMAGVTEFIDECVAGFLLEKEMEYLGNAIANPVRPFVAILGGAKISGKIDVLMNLIDKVDTIIVGGGMVYTFLKAKGLPVGKSLLEEDRVAMAGQILDRVEKSDARLLLPVDHVVADGFEDDADIKTVEQDGIEDGWAALDIGPKSIELFCQVVADAKTVVWNGPMGFFEKEPFDKGTTAVAGALAESDCVSIIGGGDSVAAINKSGLADRMTHISTGGGASLVFLEGKTLPGVAALSDS